MKRWADLERQAPDLAARGRTILFQYGPGLGYLATVRKDGGPRVHPVCPVLAAGGLYVFVGRSSPKLGDLHRDPRYALHSFPRPEVDDEFYVSGTGRPVDDPPVHDEVLAAYRATGAMETDDALFELLLDRVLAAEYGPRPSWPPQYTRWNADDG